MAAGDAAFAAFTTTSAGPQGRDPRPVQDVQGRFIQPDGRTFYEPHPGLVGVVPSATALQGGLNGAVQSNTSWVQDFERMQLAQGLQGGPGAAAIGTQAADQPIFNGVSSAPNFTHMAQDGHMMMPNNLGPLGLSNFMPVGMPGSRAIRRADPFTEHFDHYPQAFALAATSEEALDAAFAAYDQDFRSEMDQWVAQHGPHSTGNATAADPDEVMKRMADELDERRNAGDPSVLPQNDPENRAKLKAQQDEELAKYAGEVLYFMELGNDKFKNSSFTDLMRRIVNGEVVVQDNELIDVVTGEPTDSAARDSEDGPAQDEDEQGAAGSSASST